jgi:signal transduction histidine kinase
LSPRSAEYRGGGATALRRLRRRFQGLVDLRRRRSGCVACERWVAFASRLDGLQSAHDIGRVLAEDVLRALDATSTAVYLRAGGDPVYRLGASIGSTHFAPLVEPGDPPAVLLRRNAAPVLLPPDLLGSVTATPLSGTLVAALRWCSTPVGFIVVGPPSRGMDYDAADAEVLAAMAQQAAPSIFAAQLSEASPETSIGTQAVIHDIKNSVSALSMLARNAQHNLANPEFRRDALVTLSGTVERMQRLLGRLSSPSPDRLPAALELVDLGSLIGDATASLAVESRLRVLRRLEPAVIVRGDAEALRGAIDNLLINAVEAIADEGTITVTLREAAGYAIIFVTDTGPGIPPELRGRDLFSPVRSTKRGGWGVGLHHTKQAVERHGGEISVESVEGHGTTFTVSLPLRAPIESAPLEVLQ